MASVCSVTEVILDNVVFSYCFQCFTYKDETNILIKKIKLKFFNLRIFTVQLSNNARFGSNASTAQWFNTAVSVHRSIETGKSMFILVVTA